MQALSKILTSSILTAAITLPLCSQANATPISKNGYSYSGSGTTFTGAGLEWLRWSETLNMTVNEATSAYAGSGYRIATKSEGDSLIKALTPTSKGYGGPYNGADDSKIFDIVGGLVDLPLTEDPSFNLSAIASAGYGLDDNDDHRVSGFYYFAAYNDDYKKPTIIQGVSGPLGGYGIIERSDDYVNVKTTKWAVAGVMLVRDLPTAVSEPAPIALFSLGIAGLGLVNRKRKNQTTRYWLYLLPVVNGIKQN